MNMKNIKIIIIGLVFWSLFSCVKDDSDGKMIITILGRSDAGEESTGAIDYVNANLGEEYGFKVVLNGIDQNDGEKIPLLFASGDIPDIMVLRYLSDPIEKVYDNGVIRGIPKDFIAKYMPNYQQLLDENPMGKLFVQSPTSKDDVLGILNFSQMYEVPLYTVAIRDDWAKAAGYDFGDLEKEGIALDPREKVFVLPDRMILKLDELEGLMKAFKQGIIVNGKEIKSIPLGMYDVNQGESFGPIKGAFGIPSSGIVFTDDQLLDVNITPQYRRFLAKIAEWYAAGYLDKEFLSTNRTQYWDKMTAEITAMGVGGLEWIGADWAKNRPPNILAKDDDPNANAIIFPLVEGSDGAIAGGIFNPSGPFNTGSSVIVSHTVSDEKLINILRIIDFMKVGDFKVKNDSKNWLVGQYGLPGVHFDWSGEPYNSYPLVRSYENVPTGNAKMGRWPLHYNTTYSLERQKFMLPGALNKWWSEYWSNAEGTGLGQVYGVRSHRYDILNETNIQEVRQKVSERLNTLVNEFYVNTITGVVDINDDAVWNDYVEKWHSYGGQQILDETKKAPVLDDLLQGKMVY